MIQACLRGLGPDGLPCAIGGAMDGEPGMMHFPTKNEELKNCRILKITG